MPNGISFKFGEGIQYDITKNWLTFGFWGSKVKVMPWPYKVKNHFLAQYLKNVSWDFVQIWWGHPVWHYQELINFWVLGVKGQGHAMTLYGQISLFNLISSLFVGRFHWNLVEPNSMRWAQNIEYFEFYMSKVKVIRGQINSSKPLLRPKIIFLSIFIS